MNSDYFEEIRNTSNMSCMMVVCDKLHCEAYTNKQNIYLNFLLPAVV